MMICRVKKRSIPIILFTVLLLYLHCSNPEVVFPDTQNIAVRLSGFVTPIGCFGKAYLYEDVAIDSAVIDSATGCFIFDDIPRGTYQLRIIVPGYGTYKENIYLGNYRNTTGTILLSRLPSPISRISPPDSSCIVFQSCSPVEPETDGRMHFISTNDTTVEFRIDFKSPMDTESIATSLSLIPDIEHTINCNNESTGGYCSIRFPATVFFHHTELTVTLANTAKTVYGEYLDFNLTCHYFIASSCLSKAAFKAFIQQSAPIDGHGAVAPNDDIYLVFRHIMNEISVEEALSITPQEPMNLFWTATDQGEHLLRIVFPSALASATRYKLTIDTNARSDDSIILPAPITLSFTTAAFRITNYSPLGGASQVPVDTSFSYEFDLSIDSSSFYDAFSITPTVDSLQMAFSGNYQKVIIHHSWLLSEQHYTVTIDTGLVTVKGTHLRSTFSHSFTTAKYPSIIRAIIPTDTVVPVATDTIITVEFNISMAPESFSGRLHITPDLPFTPQWETPQATRLRLIALQTLQSNTVYTLTIDSGYTSAQGITGNTVVSRFKTDRLRIIALSPWHNRINVPVQGRFSVSFNTPVDTGSFLSHIIIAPPVDSITVIPLDSSTTTAVVSIGHSPLSENTRYTITLDGAITDIYGIPMEQEFSFSFTTE